MTLTDALSAHDVPPLVRDALEREEAPACIGDAGRILEANDRYLELVGFSRTELEAGELSWLRLTPAGSLAADARAIGEARATGKARPYEKSYVRRDGGEVQVTISLKLLSDDPLRLLAVLALEGDEQARATVEALA
jgi:PAS domain S-box-containing protein